ncbi:H-NS family nucleoid-associated regulatory protein [Paraburkholderia tropica]|uniref:H-NS family nucleoid-associated regulatory protein n=1 Tax=Paraburkholderia tropica TaxID=92647 RepID=UPI001FC8A853|nr:H-NS family nucleoid-associated regulatory protein [Paraburkholderia tropica]
MGYDRPAPAKYYDPATGRKWSGRGRRPAWLAGKRLEDYAIDALRSQLWWHGEE